MKKIYKVVLIIVVSLFTFNIRVFANSIDAIKMDINILENSIYVHDIHQDAGANKFDIILSANCDSYEHRFILAHEIGHFILHRDKGRCYANRLKNSKNKTVEDEADLFAGSLLLPEKTFKDAYKSLDGNYGDLSLYFRVPWDIIARRVKRLRLGIK